MATIATTIEKSLKLLGHTVASQDLERYQTEVVPDLWSNELGRLRIWTANLGAHQTGQSSLDFRLREASHLKEQILRVLGRLQRTIQDLETLLHATGLHEEYSTDSDDSEEEDQTEIQKIYHALHDTISILFDNAVAIRRPAQHDRLLGVKRSDTAEFELWDRKHVADKFPGLDPAIRDRLGLAISQRRATLKYRERHHLKLAQGLDSVEDTGLSETVATELVVEPAEDNFDLQSTTSQTSYAKTIMNGREGMVVLPPPKGSLNGDPFECPYCFLLIKVNNRHSWTQHVFHDLMPYLCVFPNCRIPHRLFESRREWYAHLQNEHSVPDEPGSSISCPLCSMSVDSVKPFQRHLGRHLQELALFALPRSSPDEDNESDTSTKPEQLEEDLQHIMLEDFDELDTSAKAEIKKISDPSHSSHSYDAQKTVDCEHVFSGDKNGTFKCKWSGCSYNHTFSSKIYLLRHVREQHVNPRFFKCPLCDHATRRQYEMRAHKLAMHNDASEQPQMVDADLYAGA